MRGDHQRQLGFGGLLAAAPIEGDRSAPLRNCRSLQALQLAPRGGTAHAEPSGAFGKFRLEYHNVQSYSGAEKAQTPHR